MELVNSIQLLYNFQERGRNVLRRHGFHFFLIPLSSVYTGYQNIGDHYDISIQVCNSVLMLYTWLLLLLFSCPIPFSPFSNSSSSSYLSKKKKRKQVLKLKIKTKQIKSNNKTVSECITIAQKQGSQQ